MAKDKWFRCDPTDYLGGIETLESPEQIAMYTVVIMRIYQAGAAIPDNPGLLGAQAAMKRSLAARIIDQLVGLGKLQRIGDRLMNPRAAAELAAQEELSALRAEAGKKGGRPSRKNAQTSGKLTGSDQNSPKSVENANGSEPEMAENCDVSKANAFPRREENRRDIPLPPSAHAAPGQDLLDFDQPLEPGERERIAARISGLADRTGGLPVPSDVNLPELISQIMRAAKMVSPPMDSTLVSGWVAMGMDPKADILPVVHRLSANARGSIRGMRYFDNELRTIFDAKAQASASNIAYFRKIRERAAG